MEYERGMDSVEDADGKEFKANFLSMSGSDVSEPLAQNSLFNLGKTSA